MGIRKIRSFFALPTSSDCRKEIIKIITDLKQSLPSGIKWVNSDILHLTLKFLGEFDPLDIPAIESTLKPIFSSINSFHLTFQSLGVFPNLSKPKVIWIGINYPESLMRLFQEIEESAFILGYPKESRPFSPHLTIGRVKNEPSDLNKIGLFLKRNPKSEICSTLVDNVVFLQSKLTPSGPVYSELFHLSLKQ